ncbi:hypothetical protein Pla175_30890 [Pirellulimonas nuda]|uniref:Planctomycete cytochrome C n=1 Tax=Pirellulimonas nuda TaxID=2528009 RepID=A0A518DDY6_9BACT|nr:DUF1549 domain-containing protein [Pirellulimonas nuda]QDU89694.1 hypothetical protein Pla175_30890 [Pirellulimonas nuda]
MRTTRWLLGVCLVCAPASGAQGIDFDTDVAPLFSKAGCNAASCHGSAAGQAGFRLSLFGGDPAFDFRSIVSELEGRRVNHAAPLQSLLLAKPTGGLDHGGGEVLDPDGPAARVISQWIEAGAHRKELRRLERLIVSPASFSVDSAPASLRVRVTAVFSDAQRRDVSDTAVYESHNDAALAVDGAGGVRVNLAGQHTAVVRFGGQAVSFSVSSPLGAEPPVLPASASANWVDEEVNAKLLALRLAPAGPCGDRQFIRRVTLDLAGRLPEPAEVERFVADASATKRAELIDALLESDGFTEYWTHRLATQLRVQNPGGDPEAAEALYRWLREQVAADQGWDAIARSLILSQGDTHQNGAAVVHRFFPTAREEAEYVSETLMGVRLRCANCHNHPLDRWTQDDYHGLAAVFAGVDRGRVVRFTGRGEITHPRTGGPAAARIPGDRFLAGGADGRQEFADWLTSPANPYFAEAMAGRVWEALMGRGLVSPVDDLRVTNPPSHPELLQRLSTHFADDGYRLRPLVRLICNSAAYNRGDAPASDAGAADDRFYSHALAKPLSAEVLADAISDVTGVADDYAGAARAINVVDRTVSAPALEALGQCLPGEPCSSAEGGERGIAAQLRLMNGDLMNAKIAAPAGRLHTLIGRGDTTPRIVEAFYLHALSRPPNPVELADWADRIDTTTDPQERTGRLEDFLWALLNSHEFSANH